MDPLLPHRPLFVGAELNVFIDGLNDIPGSKSLAEDVQDTPLKTAVELKVALPRSATREKIDGYLPWLYSNTMARTGFKHREHPNSVYAFVFYEGHDWKNDPTGWVARVSKAAADAAPSFDNKAVSGDLVSQVRAVLGKGPEVAPTEDGVRVDYEASELSSGAAGAKKDVWFAAFFILSEAFSKVSKLDKLRVAITYKDKPAVELTVTRKDFAALKYAAEIESLATVEAKLDDERIAGRLSEDAYEAKRLAAYLATYRKLLAGLPPDGQDIQARYRP